MADYRLYLFDRGKHIRQVVALECASDEEAIEVAAAHADGHQMELWNLARKVRTFPADTDSGG